MNLRFENNFQLTVEDESYEVNIREVPFREGLELSCEVSGEIIRVSDRGLGIDDAKKILAEEILKFKNSFS